MKQGKHTLLFVVIVLINFTSIAQNVAINATGAIPNASAMLDISASNRGLLIPRVALSQTSLATPITTPATSLLVYNTANINDVSPGYYYWNGSQWVRFFTGSQSDDWTLLGNAGTNPSTNFLGTTDAQDLVFRTANTEKMRVESGGNVGIGTNNPNYKLHLYGTSNNAADVYSQTDAGRIVKHWFVNAGRRWTVGQIGTTQAPNYSFQITDETAGSPRMSITTAGNVGIGTTSPAAKLHVNQTSTTANAALIETMASSTTYYGLNVITAGTTRLYVRADGNVGIATTAPTQTLDVNGNVRLREHLYDATNSPGNDGDILSRDANGVLWINSSACENYDESFESNFGIWTNLTDDDADWTRHSGSTSSSTTGPTSANDGSYYIYCETSSPRVAGDVFSMQTNVRTCDNPSISFDYHMYFNTATDGTLSLEVSNDGGTTWTNLWSMTGNQGNVWNNDQTVSLAAYSNAFINLRFSFTIGSAGTSYQYDCALDDILLSDINGVYPVSGGSSGSGWELLGNAGTNPTTNFLGTTDNQELAIRTNNTEKIRITTQGQIEPVNTGNSVFIGNQAGENDDLSGNQNVFVGYFCGRANTTGNNNIAIGDNALTDNISGNYNTALGVNALADNNTGSNNIALGNGASFNNITGNYNIAHGAGALSYNTAGSDNIAMGHYAANRNQSSDNIAIGNGALGYATTTSDYNIAIGYMSMRRGTNYTGTTHNVSIGYESMYNISGGDNNVSIGRLSMRNTSTGYENVSIGYEAMYDNTTGYNNVALGERALYNNISGNNNVAIGYWSCQNTSTASRNVGVGQYSLYQNTGSYNTGVGYAAGAGVSGPSYTYCTYLGYDADFSVTGTYTNAMALGYDATVTATNRVRIGNTSVTRIGGQVGWTILSDGRIKENVQENVSGIDFIMKLRPVTYNFNKDKQDQILNNTDSSEYAEKYDIEKIKFSGFIAQEVEQAALEVGYDFSGVKKPANQNDLYGLSYSEFVVPLVKATQEQQEDIEALKKENQALRKEIEELRQMILEK